jgi:hypothetical protein
MKMSKRGRLGLRLSAVAVLGLAILSGPSAKTSRRAPGIPPEVVSLMAAYGAEAITLDRGARDYRQPDQIDWKGRPGTPNSSALVFGDPAKPGWYVYMLKRGPNDWSRPHTHQYDRYITVLAGTMWIGTGSKFDPDHTVGIKAGGVIRDIANQPHFDGTKDDGLTIEIMGMGPATSIPAEVK